VLLIEGSASPHDYSLRPSEAKALDSADLLFWTSRDLTPWLYKTLNNRRQPIDDVELMSTPQTHRLSLRNNDNFGGEHDHSSHGHENDADFSHDDAYKAGVDPHGWLDPANAIYWLDVIAKKLSEADPDNRSTYQNNAATAKLKIDTLTQNIITQLLPIKHLPFIVFHDSYHYFEQRFDIHAEAAIALIDAELPGIRRMNKLKEQLLALDNACVFSEPQFSDKMVSTLIRGLSISTGSLDSLGAYLEPGETLYTGVLQQIANELISCLEPDAN